MSKSSAHGFNRFKQMAAQRLFIRVHPCHPCALSLSTLQRYDANKVALGLLCTSVASCLQFYKYVSLRSINACSYRLQTRVLTPYKHVSLGRNDLGGSSSGFPR